MVLFNRNYLHVLGTLSYAFSQWLILTLCIRMLSVDAAGYYVYYLALLTPLSIFFNFGLRSAISSDISREYTDISYIKARGLGLFLYFLSSGLLIYWVNEYVVLGWLVFITKFIDSFSELAYGNWVRLKVPFRCGISQILRLFLFVTIFLVFWALWGKEQSVLLLFMYPLSMLVVFYIYDRIKSDFDILFTSIDVLKLIKKSVPLALSGLLVALTSSFPRTIVKELTGADSLALYAVLLYFISLAAIPVSSICQIYIPHMTAQSSSISKSSYFIKKIILIILLYSVLFFLGVVGLGPFVLEYVYSISNPLGGGVFFLIGGAGFFVFFIYLSNAIFVARRKFYYALTVAIFNIFSVVILTYSLASGYGIWGALIAFAISNALNVLFSIAIIINRGVLAGERGKLL